MINFCAFRALSLEGSEALLARSEHRGTFQFSCVQHCCKVSLKAYILYNKHARMHAEFKQLSLIPLSVLRQMAAKPTDLSYTAAVQNGSIAWQAAKGS